MILGLNLVLDVDYGLGLEFSIYGSLINILVLSINCKLDYSNILPFFRLLPLLFPSSHLVLTELREI